MTNIRWRGMAVVTAAATALALGLVAPPAMSDEVAPANPTYSEEWDGRGSDSLKCVEVGEDDPRYEFKDGWIHWVFSTKGGSTNATLMVEGDSYQPGEPLNAKIWHFYTPYYEVDGLTASIDLFGGDPGPGGGLVISDYCDNVPEEPSDFELLEVSKTVVTSYERTHKWTIDKSVDPKVMYLYANGSGDGKATWKVVVDYKGYDDSKLNVSGEITIKNAGTLPATITSVVDVLPGDIEATVECDFDFGEFGYTLAKGAETTCTYSQDVESKIDGDNVVTVTTALTDSGNGDPFNGEKAIVWGDPSAEYFKKVTVKDYSDLFGEKELGTVTVSDAFPKSFTYEKSFAWADYDAKSSTCQYTYDNTAKIVETKQESSATLTVKVQCLTFKGETAWAANGLTEGEKRYTPRGNWATYVQYAEKTTNLFAGQSMKAGTVSFSGVSDGKVTITVNLDSPWEYKDAAANLKVQGYATAPSGNPSPGLFANKQSCDAALSMCTLVVPAANYYGVHADVGKWAPVTPFGP